MPEDLPKAVFSLIWLLVGVIVLGYLIMKYAALTWLGFIVVYYVLPILWYTKRNKP